MARLFLDSNVLVSGLVVLWSFDRVVLKYCAVQLHRMVYAEAVKIELRDSCSPMLIAIKLTGC